MTDRKPRSPFGGCETPLANANAPLIFSERLLVDRYRRLSRDEQSQVQDFIKRIIDGRSDST